MDDPVESLLRNKGLTRSMGAAPSLCYGCVLLMLRVSSGLMLRLHGIVHHTRMNHTCQRLQCHGLPPFVLVVTPTTMLCCSCPFSSSVGGFSTTTVCIGIGAGAGGVAAGGVAVGIGAADGPAPPLPGGGRAGPSCVTWWHREHLTDDAPY